MPGRRAAVIETLGSGELVGWSWLFKPYASRLGAEAMMPVRPTSSTPWAPAC
ncbi:hypothetical protein L1606_04855 [Streptomyces spororaveus]|nr:hypothetical protein [Streptomyces spororaveus]MCM9077415.1 hypothetical protein [Streptomyces spororaveus]